MSTAYTSRGQCQGATAGRTPEENYKQQVERTPASCISSQIHGHWSCCKMFEYSQHTPNSSIISHDNPVSILYIREAHQLLCFSHSTALRETFHMNNSLDCFLIYLIRVPNNYSDIIVQFKKILKNTGYLRFQRACFPV